MFSFRKSMFTLSALYTLSMTTAPAYAAGSERNTTGTQLECTSEPLDSYGSMQWLSYSGKSGRITEISDYYDGTVYKNIIEDGSEKESQTQLLVSGVRKAVRFLLVMNKVSDQNYNAKAVESVGGTVENGKVVNALSERSLNYNCKLVN